MPEPSNKRLAKAMKGVTLGTVSDINSKATRLALDGLREVEEQVWIDFSGLAEEFASWSHKDIEFVEHFVDATGQRDSPFERPHFTFGAVLETPTPVAVLAVVLSYETNDRNETVGARVAIGVLSSDQAVRVKGRVNLTFQGYGQQPSGLADDIGVEG